MKRSMPASLQGRPRQRAARLEGAARLPQRNRSYATKAASSGSCVLSCQHPAPRDWNREGGPPDSQISRSSGMVGCPRTNSKPVTGGSPSGGEAFSQCMLAGSALIER